MISASITNALRKSVYRRDHFRCVLCDSTDGLQIHHAIPRGEGGSNSPQNLVSLCWRCHGVIHGGYEWHIGDRITSEEAAQLCVEYLADYYPDDRHVWNPWEK